MKTYDTRGGMAMDTWWTEPVTSLKGIGKKRAAAFERLEIRTIAEFAELITPARTATLIFPISSLSGNWPSMGRGKSSGRN